jgi:adenine phosphoribosyltransferase
MEELKRLIREVPDFPKPGILFYDITTLLKDPSGLQAVLRHFEEAFQARPVDKVVGIESRGFIFAPTLACRLNAGFVPIRKPGKLPAETIQASYELEYGQDSLEIHRDAVEEGESVLIVDDLIATGGTARAAVELVRRLGGQVTAVAVLIELEFLRGRDQLENVEVLSLLRY